MPGLAGDWCPTAVWWHRLRGWADLMHKWISCTSYVFRCVLVRAVLVLGILCQAGKDQHSHSQVGAQSASSLMDGNGVRS